MRERNEHDEAIDKVLAGLRDVDPSPGMNRRILTAARERASVQSSSPWYRLGFAWPSRSLATGLLASAAVATIVVIALFAMNSRPIAPPSSQARLSPKLPVTVSPVSSPVPVNDARPRLVRSVQPVRDRARVTSRQPQLVSYPAPPMPLTEQEKLLLQIIHKNDPVEIALLNPDLRSRREAEDRDNFQKFFDTSTTKKN
ncbi:hypothetical protein [Granulicella arctica]|uniref:hypothetical protein n=1 Tax=Granulicella arctica TaxID=940613 RepID=UPI0021E04613|nr:hypothetical protein [Granulicella arctica]